MAERTLIARGPVFGGHVIRGRRVLLGLAQGLAICGSVNQGFFIAILRPGSGPQDDHILKSKLVQFRGGTSS